jgi:serine/threonine-protein kinase
MLAAPPLHQLDGKYRVLAQLGQGGTAYVSLAALRGPSGFNKLVVLKSMKHSLKSEPEFARMFMTEARLAARLNHPNIVQTNEVFEFHGLPVIVMEYLEGQPLSNILVRGAGTGSFTLAMHLRVLADTLGGLHYSHELEDYDGTPLGVVHRDVSPHNVFVTFDGQVKLLDFGIAKLAGSHSETATGVIKGKLRYMPPEQIAAEGVDRRSDIYSMGVMLWEALTGKKMWQGLSDATVMNRILGGQVVRVRDLNPNVAPELERIVEKALAGERDERFGSALEMQAALDEYIDALDDPPHHRDLGKAVATLFAEERKQTRQVIEEQLSKVARLSQSEYERVQPIELTTFASVSGAMPARTSFSDEQAQAARRTQAIGIAALLVTSLVLLVAFGWGYFRRPEAASVAAASSIVMPAPAAPELPKRVTVRVTAFPATAKLSLGGELLPSNPLVQSFQRDPARTLMLVAEAPAHQRETRVIRLDQDCDVVLTLTPEAPVSAVKIRPKAKAARKESLTPAVTAAVPEPDCNPPYFFDERGVKKYKPRCL